MAWFGAFRNLPFPTSYPPRKTAVTVDVLEAGLLYVICALAFCLAIIIPGIRGRERIFYTIRVSVGMFILASIILANFGQEWEVAEAHDVMTQYRAGLAGEIHADIGLKIGLRSINITLKTNPEVQEFNGGAVKERINYNERFHWDNDGFTQGRMGFGPNAGLFNRQFRAAQLKGLPYPILWIAEYFTIDGEWIRWGRHYRQAGYYTHIMVWLAFPLWILAMILFRMVMWYGGLFSLLTGLSLICANLTYAFIRNPIELIIPVGDDKVLNTHFGWCFWLCLFNGMLAIIIGIIVIVMSQFLNEKIAVFFNFDITQELEEFYADPTEFENIMANRKTKLGNLARRLSKIKYKPEDRGPGTSKLEVVESGGYRNLQADNAQQHFRQRAPGSMKSRASSHTVLSPSQMEQPAESIYA